MTTASGIGDVPLCYYPSGGNATEDYACNLSAEASFCCARGYACLENKICANVIDNATHLWNRGSCTDESWSSQACPQFCPSFRRSRGEWIVQCEPNTNPGKVCCYDAAAESPDDCCTNSSAIVFTISGPTTAFRTIDLSAATATRSLSSPVTSTPSSMPASSDTHPSRPRSGLPSGSEAGIVVGVISGAALVVIAALYFRRRTRKHKSASLHGYGDDSTSKRVAEKASDLSVTPAEMEAKRPAEVSSEHGIVELGTNTTAHELAGSDVLDIAK